MSAHPAQAAGNVLKREVGGLPVGVWGLIVAGGIVAGRRLMGGSSRQATSEVTPFIDPNSTGYTATGEPATSSGSDGVSSNPLIPTNAVWRNAALTYLVSLGDVNYVLAEAAVNKFLSGGYGALNPTEMAVINRAVKAIGPPPEAPGEPPVVVVPGANRPPRKTTVLAPYGLGENANQVASRIRRPVASGGLGTLLTTDGKPLTASYIIRVNGLNVGASRALRPGTSITY